MRTHTYAGTQVVALDIVSMYARTFAFHDAEKPDTHGACILGG